MSMRRTTSGWRRSIWPGPIRFRSTFFAPDGTWLGTVSLPPRLVRAYIHYRSPYLEIGDDYILGVWKDELDVQYVRMYRLNR